MMDAWLRANVAHQLAQLHLAVQRAQERREGAIDIDIVKRAVRTMGKAPHA
jgi:Mrp family chromosome partitioning ATPase